MARFSCLFVKCFTFQNIPSDLIGKIKKEHPENMHTYNQSPIQSAHSAEYTRLGFKTSVLHRAVPDVTKEALGAGVSHISRKEA